MQRAPDAEACGGLHPAPLRVLAALSRQPAAAWRAASIPTARLRRQQRPGQPAAQLRRQRPDGTRGSGTPPPPHTPAGGDRQRAPTSHAGREGKPQHYAEQSATAVRPLQRGQRQAHAAPTTAVPAAGLPRLRARRAPRLAEEEEEEEEVGEERGRSHEGAAMLGGKPGFPGQSCTRAWQPRAFLLPAPHPPPFLRLPPAHGSPPFHPPATLVRASPSQAPRANSMPPGPPGCRQSNPGAVKAIRGPRRAGRRCEDAPVPLHRHRTHRRRPLSARHSACHAAAAPRQRAWL